MDKVSKRSGGGEIAIGIDIGTTTVSATAYDLTNRSQPEACAVPHRSYVRSEGRSEQSVSVILAAAEALLDRMLEAYPHAVSIGITGQMHGIVYVDGAGCPVSELINWQDNADWMYIFPFICIRSAGITLFLHADRTQSTYLIFKNQVNTFQKKLSLIKVALLLEKYMKKVKEI